MTLRKHRRSGVQSSDQQPEGPLICHNNQTDNTGCGCGRQFRISARASRTGRGRGGQQEGNWNIDVAPFVAVCAAGDGNYDILLTRLQNALLSAEDYVFICSLHRFYMRHTTLAQRGQPGWPTVGWLHPWRPLSSALSGLASPLICGVR